MDLTQKYFHVVCLTFLHKSVPEFFEVSFTKITLSANREFFHSREKNGNKKAKL